MNCELRPLIKRKLPPVLQHNGFLFGYDEDSHLHVQVLHNNVQSEEANGLHLLMPARQEQAEEFTHILGTKVLPPKQYKTRKQNRAVQQRQLSCRFLASCLHSWTYPKHWAGRFLRAQESTSAKPYCCGTALTVSVNRRTSGSKCLLTVSALLLSDDLDPSKSGWQCHGERVLHRKGGPVTASEPKSYSRKRQHKTSDFT